MPSYVHDTFADALAEADRLKRANRGHRFFVMAPVTDLEMVSYAAGWSRGLTEGRKDAYRDVVNADARADRARDAAYELRAALKLLEVFADKADEFQATVADCQLWFDGFAAAQSGRESWDRSHLPSRDSLVNLNAALQAVMRSKRPADELDDSEIPF